MYRTTQTRQTHLLWESESLECLARPRAHLVIILSQDGSGIFNVVIARYAVDAQGEYHPESVAIRLAASQSRLYMKRHHYRGGKLRVV